MVASADGDDDGLWTVKTATGRLSAPFCLPARPWQPSLAADCLTPGV